MHINTVPASLLVLALLGVCLSGCGALTKLSEFVQEQETVAELTVKAATIKFIDKSSDPQRRAMKIQKVADTTLELASDIDATVPKLMAEVRIQVPWSDLDTADQLLASALLTTVENQLQERLKSKSISEDQLVGVQAVLSWVLEAAAVYSPQVND
jgi:hypothetical protein